MKTTQTNLLEKHGFKEHWLPQRSGEHTAIWQKEINIVLFIETKSFARSGAIYEI